MEEPKFVEFTGISRKGKNRISNFGRVWRLLITGEFQGQPAIFVESLDRRACRWVLLTADEDFCPVSVP